MRTDHKSYDGFVPVLRWFYFRFFVSQHFLRQTPEELYFERESPPYDQVSSILVVSSIVNSFLLSKSCDGLFPVVLVRCLTTLRSRHSFSTDLQRLSTPASQLTRADWKKMVCCRRSHVGAVYHPSGILLLSPSFSSFIFDKDV
jgi:hypothetical protein